MTVTAPPCSASGGGLFWHDSDNWTGPGRLINRGVRQLAYVRRGDTLVAHYRIQRLDTRGEGLFIFTCNGNPSATFTVT